MTSQAGPTIQGMATKSIKIDAELLEHAERIAQERGVAVQQLIQEALKHELGKSGPPSGQGARAQDEGEQPPFSCIGAFRSGRGDLSRLASEDVFEPEPFR